MSQSVTETHTAPADRQLLLTDSSASCFLPTRASLVLSPARWTAAPAPIPELAPVISSTLSEREEILSALPTMLTEEEVTERSEEKEPEVVQTKEDVTKGTEEENPGVKQSEEEDASIDDLLADTPHKKQQYPTFEITKSSTTGNNDGNYAVVTYVSV